MEEEISAFGRKQEIIARAEELRDSEAFKSLESQTQQTLENYLTALGGGLEEDGVQYKNALAEMEKFLNSLEQKKAA